MSRVVEERQIRAIYEAIDTGSYKNAAQQANKFLKKQPKHQQYRALKCLALSRTGRADDEAEAHTLVEELIREKPTDQVVLGPLSHALRQLNRPFDALSMFDAAYKQAPGDEELGAQAFMANVRVGHWKAAQLLATRIGKQLKQDRWTWWAVMCAVLQASDGATAAHVRNVLLQLALRMIEMTGKPSHVQADRFALHLDLLQALDRTPEALTMLEDTAEGRALFATSPAVQEIARELTLRAGRWEQEWENAKKKLQEGDRTGETTTALINGALYTPAPPKPETIPMLDPTLPQPVLLGGPTVWPVPPELSEDQLAEVKRRAGEAKEELDAAVRKDLSGDKKERTGLLALLELEQRVGKYGEGMSVVDRAAVIEQYVTIFGDKPSAFEDVLPHLKLLVAKQRETLVAFAQSLPSTVDSDKAIQRTITGLKIVRALAPVPRSASDELVDAVRYLDLYLAALPVGADLPKTELQPADDLAALSAQAFVGAYTSSRDITHLHAALAVLVRATEASRYGYGLRLCLIRVLRLLGAGGQLAVKHWRLLGAKQVQTDTLGHYILDRASTFSLTANGDLTVLAEGMESAQIYLANSMETPEQLVRAFQFEKYSQITDFMTFQDRLENSLQRDIGIVDVVRMRLAHDGILTEIDIGDLKGAFDRVSERYDNRDFSVLPTFQPVDGPTFDVQTQLFGNKLGVQWCNIMLKTYLHAFCPVEELDREHDLEMLKKLGVELPKHDIALSVRVKTLVDEELAALTQPERAFVAFVYDLVEYIQKVDTTVVHSTANGTSNGSASTDEIEHEKTAEQLAKTFEYALAKVEALPTGEKHEAVSATLHGATLMHEQYVLFNAVTAPRVKGKKRADPFVQTVKTVKTRATSALKTLATVLIALGEKDETTEYVQHTNALLQDKLDTTAALTELIVARRAAYDGLGRGIQRCVQNS
ncbi:N-acetyltransferase B complex non catalytic subunit-domain-containing protein [Auriculariales sp. MPI-PUGE-AT-0066]|nr:N-acetyltransferase B complex non catalytic subunit-domain-containing protein [Auriculariales sp. MPI-PUGE-AT-0066]